ENRRAPGSRGNLLHGVNIDGSGEQTAQPNPYKTYAKCRSGRTDKNQCNDARGFFTRIEAGLAPNPQAEKPTSKSPKEHPKEINDARANTHQQLLLPQSSSRSRKC